MISFGSLTEPVATHQKGRRTNAASRRRPSAEHQVLGEAAPHRSASSAAMARVAATAKAIRSRLVITETAAASDSR